LCSKGFSSAPHREQYVRARLETDGGTLRVAPIGGHGSHLMGDLSDADALIVVPAGTTYVEGGSEVSVLLPDREF
jgi:molybdopterin molybdotransferase